MVNMNFLLISIIFFIVIIILYLSFVKIKKKRKRGFVGDVEPDYFIDGKTNNFWQKVLRNYNKKIEEYQKSILYDLESYEKSHKKEYLEYKSHEEEQSQTASKDKQYKSKQNTKIVDVVKPVGFWSRLIFGQNADLIRARLMVENEQDGHWVKYVKARKKLSQKKGKGL